MTQDQKAIVALSRCEHDLCMCGEVNNRGEVIGFDRAQEVWTEEGRIK